MNAQELESGGWPLGLQPLNVRLTLMDHLRLAQSSAFRTVSTPSVSTDSSSDLDTESTGSFFPETSITLGSLIGIRSIGELNDSQAASQQILSTDTNIRRNGSRQWSLCGFMGCASSDTSHESFSPSLSRLLELERQVSTVQEQKTIIAKDCSNITEGSISFGRNTLFADDRVLPPQAFGAPTKLNLEQASANSSYLSGDWSTTVPVCSEMERGGDGMT
eukprot:c29182_g1_i1 orf=157-813(-)